MRKVLIIEVLGSGNGLLLVEKAVSSGAEVVFVAESTDRYSLDISKDILDNPPSNLTILDGVETTNVDVIEALLLGKYGQGAGIISQVDRTILPVAEACNRTRHSFLSMDAARRCADKGVFRAALERSGVPGPESSIATTMVELASAVSRVGVPVVLKPSHGTGSVGVRLAWTFEQALRHGAPLLDQGIEVLVESYLVGPLLSVEVFRDQGTTLILGQTDRVLSDPPFFAELGWTFPLELTKVDSAVLRLEASRVLDAVGFDRGPAHIEFIWTANGPVAVEVNPRIAGRGLTAMVSDLSPYDEYELIVKQALGEPLTDPRPAAMGKFLSECVVVGPLGHVPSPGAVQGASSLPGVMHVRLADPWRPAQSFGTVHDLGEVRAAGSSFGEAQMRARAAAHALAASLIESAEPLPATSPPTGMDYK